MMGGMMSYPVPVIVQETHDSKANDALMYSMYPDENGVMYATCWVLESNLWLTCPLAYIKPKLEVVTKVKLNESL